MIHILSCNYLFRPKMVLNSIISLILVIRLGFYVLFLVGAHQNQQPNELMTNTEIINQQEPKRILYWTSFYDRKDMIFGYGQEPFIQAGCKVTNCWATNDRSELNQSDALIFHGVDFKADDLPDHRSPRQRYIFFNFETLVSKRNIMSIFSSKTNHYFNWTMTHRRDSDVYIATPYGALRRKRESLDNLKQQASPYYQSQDSLDRLSKLEITRSLTEKNKMVAWFCSNAVTPGRREDYAKELGKHVQIDVYGECGNMTCQPRNSPKCDSLLDNYKFYFSAENSLCPDYITEKFYRALESDVIPIVYGGADYAQYAPPHSYIHVADFGSPKELADYLHFLAGNEAMYNKYFDWKKEWEVVKSPFNGWCDLCAKLNDPESSTETKIYESISKWWFEDIPCLPGKSFIDSVLKKN